MRRVIELQYAIFRETGGYVELIKTVTCDRFEDIFEDDSLYDIDGRYVFISINEQNRKELLKPF